MSLVSNFGKAFGLLARTWPFIVIRFGVLLGAAVLSFVLFLVLIGGLLLLGVGNLLGLGLILGFVLLIAFFGIFGLLKRYFLYIYDAGHVAVMAKMLKGEDKDIPGTMKQLEYGKNTVIQRIGSLTILYAFEQIVRGIVYTINNVANFVISFLPKSLREILGFIMAIVNRAIFLIFDMTLSYLMFDPAKNAWMCAADTLVIYKKHFMKFLGLAAVLVLGGDILSLLILVFGYVFQLVVVGALVAVVGSGGGLLGVALTLIGFVLLFVMIGIFRECIVVPYSRALILCEFYEAYQDTKISKEDYGILNDIPQFRELLEKAKTEKTTGKK